MGDVMRIIAALIAIAAWTMPAFAQLPMDIGKDISHPKDPTAAKKEQERENSYKSGLSKIPDQKSNNDPWGDVRTDTKASQAKAPAAAKKTKSE
jgi:hypothetical protein